MEKYTFKSTQLIAETLERYGVKFDVIRYPDEEQLLAGFPVECGPSVFMRFISKNDDNDVAVRIFDLIANIPREKRGRMLEACNALNCSYRFLKFSMDPQGNIDVAYDFPEHCADETLGEMTFEVFLRGTQILNAGYSLFMKALYGEEREDLFDEAVDVARFQRLKALRRMIERHMADAHARAEDNEDEDDKEEDGIEDDGLFLAEPETDFEDGAAG